MKLQNGFAHALLIIVVMLALVGAIGYVLWQNSNDGNADRSGVSVQRSGNTDVDPAEVDEGAQEKQTLLVNEQGIKVNLSDRWPKLTYEIDSDAGSKVIRIFAETAISPSYPCQDKDTGYFMSLVGSSRERLEELDTDTSSDYSQVGDTYWSAGLLGNCQDESTNELIKDVVSGVSSID